MLRELKGHQGTIFSAEFSPDGERVVTASDDGPAAVWDVSWGMTLCREELVRRVCAEKLVGNKRSRPKAHQTRSSAHALAPTPASGAALFPRSIGSTWAAPPGALPVPRSRVIASPAEGMPAQDWWNESLAFWIAIASSPLLNPTRKRGVDLLDLARLTCRCFCSEPSRQEPHSQTAFCLTEGHTRSISSLPETALGKLLRRGLWDDDGKIRKRGEQLKRKEHPNPSAVPQSARLQVRVAQWRRQAWAVLRSKVCSYLVAARAGKAPACRRNSGVA
jgi:WD40 repeat protein